jgi:hypothetical protein
MSDPSLPGTPGTGPVPEPEPEGFRDEQIDAENARQVEAKEESLKASKDAYENYTGKEYPYEVPPDPPVSGTTFTGTGSRRSKAKSSETHESSKSASKAAEHSAKKSS